MTLSTRVLLPACALAFLAGCAGTPDAVQWSNVSMRDQHSFVGQMLRDEMRPTVVVTSGADGLVVRAPSAPAAHLIAEGGQLRAVSRETFARMQQDPGGTAMGASPSPAAPPAASTPPAGR